VEIIDNCGGGETLYAVTDEYYKYGNYYKTKKGAERHLKKVRRQAGEE